MKLKREKIVILVLLVVTISIFAGITIRNHLPYPENEFSIVGNESMCLSHLYNVNGVVGAEKTSFTAGERRKIMEFLAELKYKELMPIQTETIYGVPPMLTIEGKCGSKMIFSFDTDIGVREYDKDGNVISQKIYTTSEKQRNKILKIVGIIKS